MVMNLANSSLLMAFCPRGRKAKEMNLSQALDSLNNCQRQK